MRYATSWTHACAGGDARASSPRGRGERRVIQRRDWCMAVLEINDLVVDFETDQGIVQAIDHLTLSVREGEIVGLVGESGCGKTTVARCILGVVPQPPARHRAAEILLTGQHVLQMSEADL